MNRQMLRSHAGAVKSANPDALVFVKETEQRILAFDDLKTICFLTGAPIHDDGYIVIFAAAWESYFRVLRREGYEVILVEQLTLPTIEPVESTAQLLLF